MGREGGRERPREGSWRLRGLPKVSATSPAPQRIKTSGKDGNLGHGSGLLERLSGRVWGNLGRMDIPSRVPPKDEVVGMKHGYAPSQDPIGKQNRVRVTGRPGQKGGTSVKAPKSRITASSSQGFAYQPGERQPPSSEQGHFKDKPKSSSFLAGTQGQGAPRRGPGTPCPRAAEPPAQPCTQRAAVLETQRAKP